MVEAEAEDDLELQRYVELEDLVGLRHISAIWCGTSSGANAAIICIDGTYYRFKEKFGRELFRPTNIDNQRDRYYSRPDSAPERIRIMTDDERLTAELSVFITPIDKTVELRLRDEPPALLYAIDETTDLVIMEIGAVFVEGEYRRSWQEQEGRTKTLEKFSVFVCTWDIKGYMPEWLKKKIETLDAVALAE